MYASGVPADASAHSVTCVTKPCLPAAYLCGCKIKPTMFGFLKRLFGNNSDQLTDFISRGAVILDVRTPAEFKAGHVPKAVNIPLDQVQAKINTIKGYNKPVITCCASGARSGAAAGILRSAGIEVINGGPWQSVNALV